MMTVNSQALQTVHPVPGEERLWSETRNATVASFRGFGQALGAGRAKTCLARASYFLRVIKHPHTAATTTVTASKSRVPSRGAPTHTQPIGSGSYI